MSKDLLGLHEKYLLDNFRATVPFLNQIPDHIFYRLDTSELLLPEGKLQESRIMLQGLLGHYVMTYKKDVINMKIPVDRHLCANIKGASLLPNELGILQTFNRLFSENVASFVVYQNPLEIIDPNTSELAAYYKQNNIAVSEIVN